MKINLNKKIRKKEKLRELLLTNENILIKLFSKSLGLFLIEWLW